MCDMSELINVPEIVNQNNNVGLFPDNYTFRTFIKLDETSFQTSYW